MDIRTSETFNSPDADVVLRSSDNVDFLIHKKNLEFLSGGFETRTGPNEFVQLTESSDTLELLFRFTYPRRFPSLKSLQLEPLMLLADAAEKYEVFALIYACDLRLRDFLQTHPMRILEFAIKHDNKELIQESAPQLVHVTLSELVNILPDHIFKPWSLYRERYLRETKAVPLPNSNECTAARCNIVVLWAALGSASLVPGSYETINSTYGCKPCCRKVIEEYKASLERIILSLPPLDVTDV
ncbi:hypothetical protein BT96DRAFT_992759 [Gymnopus androsaceus JB14]|uniref:BTB domain-containing protein n=1 Tax=Gymnopus androsaceus JB14 TaxID=1447944 RepID=A0A6A4HVH0_9AGAR|nr:hypothetical protein BT96DRAFT_992759 [Gymnopus androsaceus JB14]